MTKFAIQVRHAIV